MSQEFLAILDDLAWTSKQPQGTLARMSIHRTIKQAREARGWSMEQLAAEVAREEGLAKPLAWQTVQQWEKEGGTAPKRKRLEVVAKIFDLSVAQLVAGEPGHESGVASEPATVVPQYYAADAILVPMLANCASMGPGESLLESDVIVGDIALSPHWINQYIRPQNPSELRFIHAYGDSMAPTFTDGDVLLVDTGPGAKDPHSREGVYVLQAGEKNYVKRVSPTFDGKLQVTSDNPSSKMVQILNGDHQVTVIGRVVWAWNGKRL